MPQFDLFSPIIRMSEADTWEAAALEWNLITIEWRDEGGHCICTHFIKEHCQIENMINGNQTIVGNCCINKFPQFTGKVYNLGSAFRALRNKKVNPALIEFALDEKVINAWEYNYMMDIWRKRKLSRVQRDKKDQITRKIYRACKLLESG